MSAWGQKQTSDWRPLMSALPPRADIARHCWDVRFVPISNVPGLRRTKATLIYRRAGNLRAVQLLLGHTKIESTVSTSALR
jgi:integrase